MNASILVATGKTTVKDHKGGRIWLEGSKPNKAGLPVGTRYSVSYTQGCMTIRVDPNGAKPVAGKGVRAIIDICGKSIADSLGMGSKVSVEYYHSMIVIKRTTT